MVARGARGLGRVGGCYTTDWWEGGRVGGEPGARGAREVTGRWGRGWVAGNFITPNWRERKTKKKITQKTLLFNYKLFIFIEKESKKVKSKNLKIQCTKPNFLSTRHISPEPEAGCPGCHGFI